MDITYMLKYAHSYMCSSSHVYALITTYMVAHISTWNAHICARLQHMCATYMNQKATYITPHIWSQTHIYVHINCTYMWDSSRVYGVILARIRANMHIYAGWGNTYMCYQSPRICYLLRAYMCKYAHICWMWWHIYVLPITAYMLPQWQHICA